MKSVWKYRLFPEGQCGDIAEVVMPADAKILKCAIQDNCLCVWALVDTEEKEMESRRFRIAGTGHSLEICEPGCYYDYIDTFFLHDGALVFHVWEVEL